MKLTITQIDLKTPFHFFRLSLYALNILKQLKGTNYVAFRKRGIWTRHYTMTLWKTEKDLQEFSRSGAHLEAMKNSSKIARQIKTITIDSDTLVDWKTAMEYLKTTNN